VSIYFNVIGKVGGCIAVATVYYSTTEQQYKLWWWDILMSHFIDMYWHVIWEKLFCDKTTIAYTIDTKWLKLNCTS